MAWTASGFFASGQGWCNGTYKEVPEEKCSGAGVYKLVKGPPFKLMMTDKDGKSSKDATHWMIMNVGPSPPVPVAKAKIDPMTGGAPPGKKNWSFCGSSGKWSEEPKAEFVFGEVAANKGAVVNSNNTEINKKAAEPPAKKAKTAPPSGKK